MRPVRYQQIVEEILQQIVSGALCPGDILPSENELAAKYNTSRVTVRKSLSMLEAQRLIYSHHGKGYFVKQPEHMRYTLIYEDPCSRMESKLHSINLIPADEMLKKALKLADEKWVVSILRTMSSGERVLIYDQVYLKYQKGMPLVEEEIKYADFPDVVKNKSSGFAVYTRMEIGHEAVFGETAYRLNVAEGTELLVVHRFLADQNDNIMAYGKQYLHPNYGRIVAYSTTKDLEYHVKNR